MSRFVRYIIAALLALSCGFPAFTQTDEKDCKDHPLITRMPGYWIHNCKKRQFDAYDFFIGKGKPVHVEGQFYWVMYYPNNTLNPKPSDLQIIRNFQNALSCVHLFL